MKLRNKKQSGFTLLELLVVVSILAIIAGSVISAISGQEERAGQGVAVHTMGALENVTRQHEVINSGLPTNLDSLICIDTTGLTSGGSTTGITGDGFGGISNLNGESGGLTQAYGEKLDSDGTIANGIDEVSLPAAGVVPLVNAGVGTLRYAEATYCDDDDTTGGAIADISAGEDDFELDETNSNRIFLQPDEGEGGRGISLTVDNTAALPVLLFADPDDIGGVEGDIVAVFGVGPGSSYISNGFIGRAPRDGNVPGGSYYSNFSVAYRLGNDPDDDGDLSDAVWQENATFLAIMDSDGDFYDDEVAEFAGLEDE